MPVAMPPSANAQRAFPSHPRVDRYFATEANEAHRRRLVELLQRGDGPGLVIAAPGVGKSMLLSAIAAELASSLQVISLACTQLCTRRALMQAILRGLDLPYSDRDEGQLRLRLVDGLETARGPVALLVDEAQSLPLRLLEELRVLSNIAVEGSPQLRVVLAGTPALDESLTAPELASFSQRIAARCYLAPLSYDETAQYVRAHIAAAGGDPDTLLQGDAYQAIHAATDGVPRLINQVGDRALMLAVERGEAVITAAAVQAAWSDLNQLPAPWHSPSASEPTSAAVETDGSAEFDSVEFGPLDDLDGEPIEIEPSTEELASPAAGDPALPVEPSAPTETSSRRVEGVWNADAGLPIAAQLAAEPDDAADDCVSLAFPGVKPLAIDPEESPEPKPAPAQPTTEDPFDESFDEEEVLLDRYADLAAVTPAGIDPVVNRQDIEFGRLFQGLDPAVESLVEDVSRGASQDGVGFKVLQAVPPVAKSEARPEAETTDDFDEEVDPIAETSSVAAASEPDTGITDTDKTATDEPGPVLVVEADDDTPAAGVQRQDYNQLFASLRQG